MDWEQLGYMFGHAGTMAMAQNYFDRGVEKARGKLAELTDPTEADRKEAMRQAETRFGGGLIGQNPQTMLLQQKRDWMQADNDAQYLLNNGYAEDSLDVQKFRQIQAKAHANADFLRGLGKSTGMDLSEVGAGMNLAELKDAVTRGIAPKLYQQYPQMQEQMAARNAWAGQTARDILGDQIAQGAQRVGVAPVAAPQPVTGAEPMTPPAAQLGGYTPQGTSLTGFDPNAGFGIPGMANPTLPDPNSHGRAITGADAYKYLQDIEYLPKEKTYAEEVEEIARDYARQRAARMDDREVRKYLKDSGVPSNIAKIVMAEQKQQQQEQMKKNALAQAAAASSSPQMAYLIAAAAADPNTKLSDLTGLINATNPDLRLDTIDLGGTKVAMTHDTKGRVKGGAQVLPVTLSPKDAAGLQFDYDKLGSEVERFNAQENRLWNTAQGNWQNRLDVARTNGGYRLASASLSGKGQGAGQDGEKRTAAEEKLASKYSNLFTNVMEKFNMEREVSREDMGDVVNDFTTAVQEGIADGTISDTDANNFYNQACFAQLMFAARFGEKEDARRIWENFDPYWRDDPGNDDRVLLDNIRDWMNDAGSAEKAHVQNRMLEQEKAYQLPPQAYNYLPPDYGK